MADLRVDSAAFFPTDPTHRALLCKCRFGGAGRTEVCAYANNQWDIQNEVSLDPSQSSFFLAMQASQGTVSILDSTKAISLHPATLLSWPRIYISFARPSGSDACIL